MLSKMLKTGESAGMKLPREHRCRTTKITLENEYTLGQVLASPALAYSPY